MERVPQSTPVLKPAEYQQMLHVAADRSVLLECDVIIVAISGAGIALDSRDVNACRRVVVADVSRPRGIPRSPGQDRPHAKTVLADLVRLPEDPEFRLTPHTPRGKCFACAAEAILRALEPQPLKLTGPIDLAAVASVGHLAEKYGLP